MDTYVQTIDLDNLSDFVRIDTFKMVIIECARITRRLFLSEAELSQECSVLSLSSLARVVLHNQSLLATRLIGRSKLAERHLLVTDGIVHFKCQRSFDAELAVVKARS